MSQNKTVIPGLEQPAGTFQKTNGIPYGGQMPFQQQNAYRRSSHSSQRATRVPGINPQSGVQQGVPPLMENTYQPRVGKAFFNSEKPVLGFLYSISRTAAGEFWPLHQGPNTIGQSEDRDIQLLEGTVSFNHAILNVRMMKNPEKMIAFITDTTSTNGTMVNGESLGSAPKDCKNGDVIVIGDHYELYLVLLDPATLGLKVAEDFIPIEKESMQDVQIPFGLNEEPLTRDYVNDPYSRMGGGYVPNNGTVGLDGSSGNINKGGTIAY